MVGMAKKKPAALWGDKLQALRKSKGLIQTAAAHLLDIPVSTLRNWEQGRTLPPPYVRRLVERILNER